jgi:hypothetical protein
MMATPSSRPVAQPLDDGGDHRINNLFEADRAGELFRDQRQGRPGGLADSQREVAGFAPHGDDEIPARRRFGVDHQVLDDLDAVMARRLESEGVDVRRQIQVVVDRLRDVDHANAAPGVSFELHGRECRIVASNRDEL